MVPKEMNRKMFFERLAGLSPGDLLEIQDAYWLAKNAHRPQTRDDGSCYFGHPRGVAAILVDRGFLRKNIIVKALCHDIVEDTNTPTNIIVRVCGYGNWCSLITLSKSVPVFDPVTGQLMGRYEKSDEVYFGEIAQASEEDRLVKLADRTHNMSTMGVWEKEHRIVYALETKQWLLPIAEATDPWFAEQLHAAVRKEVG